MVVLAGDSLTHGNVSANYPDLLEKWLPQSDYLFYNAGRNADLTYTLLRRLDDIIACRPHFVVLLIGTNDVQATMGPSTLKHYRNLRRIEPDDQPSFDSFVANYRQIIRRLKAETGARLALLSLPPITEDLSHEANRRADRYSEAIRQLAETEGLDYLPIRETMKAYLDAHPKSYRYRHDQTYWLLNLAVARHYLLGHSWDKICMDNGNDLTFDNLHLNTRGAAIIATQVEHWIQQALPGSVAIGEQTKPTSYSQRMYAGR